MGSIKLVEEYKCEDKDLTIVIALGDITAITCDAIVNPANSLMVMAGGVAGAIKKAAGNEVEEAARKRAPVPVGKSVATEAGRLVPRVHYIIHAPTMERPAMRTTMDKVRMATKAALGEAIVLGVKCVAFPAMGAGVGGLSAEESMKAMLEALDETVAEAIRLPEKIVFVAYTETDLAQFSRTLARARLKNCRIRVLNTQ